MPESFVLKHLSTRLWRHASVVFVTFWRLLKNKKIFSWALYDWANSTFATTVMAGFFPIFFKEYWSAGVDVTRSTFHLGVANSSASLLLALLAPLLGAFADRGRSKATHLMIFTALGCAATGALFYLPQGMWQWAAFSYAVGAFCYAAAVIYYDSLIVRVTTPENYDRVSGLGYALGYLGGGILFVINTMMVLRPELFGLADMSEAVRWSFLSVALWWFVFSLPLYFSAKDQDAENKEPLWYFLKHSIRQVNSTVKKIIAHKPILVFLLGYFFYIEGVNTTVKMAVDYGLSIGLETNDLLLALIIVQFVAFPFAIFFGWLGTKIGAKHVILIGLSVYASAALLGMKLTTATEFYFMAAAIGSVQGGVQALSRSHFAAMIPKNQSGEYFGFFNMLGKFSAVIGPVLVGTVSLLSGSPRISLLVILAFILMGAFLLFIHDRTSKSN